MKPFTIAIALLITTIIFILLVMTVSRRLRERLSLRIAALILITGPIVLIALVGFNGVFAGSLHHLVPIWVRFVQVFLIIFGTPVLLGILASLYVTRPLRQFMLAIASLKQNNYHVTLEPSGIREFDQVFTEFNDLTSRLLAEEELRKNLISDTSHELNTPVTTMLSQLTAMEENVLPATPARLKTLRQQTERLAELINQLNEYTKARSLIGANDATDIALYDLCTDLQQMFAAQLDKQDMQLEIAVAPHYTVHASRQALDRIMINLIQNALRYAHGTNITIKATKKHLVIADNGQGVPPESLPYLFERFYRVDPSRSRQTGGLGLGLAIVSELANRQGWHIHAENTDPGLKIIIDL